MARDDWEALTEVAEVADVLEVTSETSNTSVTSTTSVASATSVNSKAESAIRAALPTAERTKPSWFWLWSLTRNLKGIFDDENDPRIETAVLEWHRLQGGDDEDGEAVLGEFWKAWARVKYPAGADIFAEAVRLADENPLPIEAEQFDSRATCRLVALCAALQSLNAEAPFFLSARSAAGYLGTDHMKANALLALLVKRGVLEVAERHTARKATRYRYLPTTHPPTGPSDGGAYRGLGSRRSFVTDTEIVTEPNT